MSISSTHAFFKFSLKKTNPQLSVDVDSNLFPLMIIDIGRISGIFGTDRKTLINGGIRSGFLANYSVAEG